VTAFQESKSLDEVTLKSLISSFKSHEIELMVDELVKVCGIEFNQKFFQGSEG
jgi:hypothetical protein